MYTLLSLLLVGETPEQIDTVDINNGYIKPIVQDDEDIVFVRPLWTKTATIDPKFLATESIALESILYQTNKLSK